MIEKYIKAHVLSKFGNKQSLVIYDKDKLYRDLILDIDDENISVFDISENVITRREEALDFWVNDLVSDQDKKLIVYTSFAKDLDPDLLARDPFVFFGEGINFFPDEAMDDYKQLCFAALPSKTKQIEDIFSNDPLPSFSLINTLEKGNDYPMLKEATKAESDSEIYQSILCPTSEVQISLSKDKAWIKEAKAWSKQVLKYPMSKASLKGIQDDLWVALLYSEFIFDLPNKELIPESLQQVKTIDESCKALVYKVAQGIRKNVDSNDNYISRANKISKELRLEDHFNKVDDLGRINTFSFEDKTYFNQFIDAILTKDSDKATQLLKDSQNSIWSRYDDETEKRWRLGQYSLEMMNFVDQEEKSISKDLSLDQLIESYASKWYSLDRLNREFEKVVTDLYSVSKSEQKLIASSRETYRTVTEKVQSIFQSKFISDYTSSKVLKNIDLFDKKVSPFIKVGRKTAYILVDALRFELAKTFVERLERASFEVDIEPSLAFIPSITKYGMAALLPSAGNKLSLKIKSGKLLPFFDDQQLDTRDKRKKYTEEIYGDKVAWYWIDEVLSKEIDPSKDIYFITSTEIDGAGENLPDNALLLIESSLKKLLKLCMQLTDSGIEEMVIVADHGFVLNESFVSGNKSDKPSGEWSLSKVRCLAGKGDKSDSTITMSPEDLMIKADVDSFHFLKQYATFRSGAKYFHEGISLQELVTPYISLRKAKSNDAKNVEVYLNYKGKTEGIITTRRPKITIDSSVEGMLFAEPMDILIEIVSGDKTVGRLASASNVDPTTEYLEIIPGQNDKLIIAMEDDFEGEFMVYAKSPSTGIVLSKLNLKTDYL